MSTPLRLLLLGAPGAGKGTITKKLQSCIPNLTAIASGDLLRQEIQSGSKLGIIASKYIAQGKLIPDGLIISLLTNHMISLTKQDSKASWILDGFPRTLTQAESLFNTLTPRNENLTKVIELNVPESAILGRIQSRWIHVQSGRVYNLAYNPPQIPGIDDITGEPLVKRIDDNEATLTKRLKEYKEMVAPLRNYYNGRGILDVVEGETSDIIFPKVLNLLK